MIKIKTNTKFGLVNLISKDSPDFTVKSFQQRLLCHLGSIGYRRVEGGRSVMSFTGEKNQEQNFQFRHFGNLVTNLGVGMG